MKLSDYAKLVGVTYKTAWQWWKAGQLDAYQLPTGTIIVRDPQAAASDVALYVRVLSADQKEDASRQVQRLREYAAARGYRVMAEVLEIASGLNDERPKLKMLLTSPRVGVLVVELGAGSRALATAISPRSWSNKAAGWRRSIPAIPRIGRVWWMIS